VFNCVELTGLVSPRSERTMEKQALEEELARLRDGPEPDDFLTAMHRLEAMGQDAVERLREVVGRHGEHPGYRARAIETLASIAGSSAQEQLLRLVSDPEFQVRWTAVVELGMVGDAQAIPVLEELRLTDDAEWQPQPGFVLSIRKAAAEALGRINARDLEE
jgi:HEAT repeat protein